MVTVSPHLSDEVADESNVLERRLWSDDRMYSMCWWFVASIVVARENVGVPDVVIPESVRGGQRVFHDEALKKSLFFDTMCKRCSSSNIAVGGTEVPRIHVPTLPGFKCEQISRNFFLSQHTSTEQHCRIRIGSFF